VRPRGGAAGPRLKIPMNKFLSRNTPLIAWLGGLGLPFAVIIAGWLITSGTETSKLESEYVRMALGILTSYEKTQDGSPRPLTDDEKALRQWAVRLLNKKSPEKFTEEEQKGLLNIRKPFGDLSPEEAQSLGAVFLLHLIAQSVGEQANRTPAPTPQHDETPTPTPQP